MRLFAAKLLLYVFYLILCYADVRQTNEESQWMEVSYRITTGQNANDETIIFSHGNEEIHHSPILEDFSKRHIRFELDRSFSANITVQLSHTRNKRWSDDTQLVIYGEYGNTIVKTHGYDTDKDFFSMSFLYTIPKKTVWKLFYSNTSIPMDWISSLFNDKDWSDYAFGIPIKQKSISQYYRKQFIGRDGISAYELRVLYRFGMMTYINGNLVIQDNMPPGAVCSATLANGGYSSFLFRTFLRSASELSTTANIIAIETHQLSLSDEMYPFDAWLALYFPSPHSECYVYGYDVVTAMFSDGQEQSAQATILWNLSRQTVWKATAHTVDMIVSFGDIHAAINQMSIYSVAHTHLNPRSIQVFGYVGKGAVNTTWTQGVGSKDKWELIMNEINPIYAINKYNAFRSWPLQNMYPFYRVSMKSISTSMELYQFRVEICSDPRSIELRYPREIEYLIVNVTNIDIGPTVSLLDHCYSNSALPFGIKMDGCRFKGIPQIEGKFIIYIQTIVHSVLLNTSISFDIHKCDGTIVRVNRIYGKSSFRTERAVIIDKTSGEEVYKEIYNGNSIPAVIMTTNLCLTHTSYSLHMESINSYFWETGSRIFLYEMVADSMLPLLETRYDNRLGTGTTIDFFVASPIPAGSQWYYVMGKFPADMLSSNVSSEWHQASRGYFPSSSNQIQVYKMLFNVTQTIDFNIIEFYIFFRWGCYVYLNGLPIYRLHVTEDPEKQQYGAGVFPESQFVRFTSPLYLLDVEQSDIVGINVGMNTVTVILLADNSRHTKSTFDCLARFTSHSLDNRVVTNAIFSPPFSDSLFTDEYGSSLVGRPSTSSGLGVSFPQHAQEWINGVVICHSVVVDEGSHGISRTHPAPRSLRVFAMNEDDTSLTLLSESQSLYWYDRSQCMTLWLSTVHHFNTFRIVFNEGDEDDTQWEIGSVRLIANNRDTSLVPLQYPDISVYSGETLRCVLPLHSVFTRFSSSNMPSGLQVDSLSGCIHGAASTAMAGVMEITAVRQNGNITSCLVNFTITPCNGEHVLTTVELSVGELPDQFLWELRNTISGEVVYTSSVRYIPFTMTYHTLCLPKSSFSIRFGMNTSDDHMSSTVYIPYKSLHSSLHEESVNDVTEGDFPSFFRISLYDRSLVLLVRGLSSLTTNTFGFSNYVVIEPTDVWKLCAAMEDLPAHWTKPDYVDKIWSVSDLISFKPEDVTTVYCRFHLRIPDHTHYDGIHIQMQFSGGVIIYFNGFSLGRYNIPENASRITLALRRHDSTATITRYVNTIVENGVIGINTLAVEVHRYADQSSSRGILFSLMARMTGYDDGCIMNSVQNVVLKRHIDRQHSPLNLFDSELSSWIMLSVLSGDMLSWELEDMDNEVFNTLHIIAGEVSDISFSLQAFKITSADGLEDGNEWHELLAVSRVTLHENIAYRFEVPPGLVGFRSFRLLFSSDSVSVDHLRIHQIFLSTQSTAQNKLQYCSSIRGFHAVFDGQTSARDCGHNSNYFIFSVCENGVFLDDSYSACTQKTSPFSYSFPQQMVVNCSSEVYSPHSRYTYSNFVVEPDFPAGLKWSFFQESGDIVGSISEIIDPPRIYTIWADNGNTAKSTVISIWSRLPQCISSKSNSSVPLGSIDFVHCNGSKNPVGVITMRCNKGHNDGIWEFAEGLCVDEHALVTTLFVGALFTSFLWANLFQFVNFCARKMKTHRKSNKRTSSDLV